MSGWKDWAIGEVVTESDFQSFVQDQVVQVYDDSTDRDNTLGTAVAEGMVAYLKDTDSTIVYDGTAWIAVGAGDITGVTAGTALTGGGVSGDVTLDVDISALATAHAGNALNANGELLDVDESAITVAQSQVTDLVSDLADKADNADFTGGTAGYTALSNGTAGLSYQPVSHNYIINGAFDIAQRGTSFTAHGYTLDRWKATGATAVAVQTVSQQALTPAEISGFEFDYKMRHVVTDVNGATAIQLQQLIENVSTLAGQTATLSFWAKADTTRSASVGGGQHFGSGGSSTVPIASQAFTLTSSWQRFTFNFTIPSIAGKTVGSSSFLYLTWNWPVDTFTIEITGVQLEAGSIATPFKRNANSIAGELAACKRYFQRIDPQTNFSWWMQVMCTGADTAIGVVEYTEKRAGPSISVSSATDFGIYTSDGSTRDTVSSISFSNARVDRARANFTSQNNVSLSAGDASIISARNVNAVIDIDAEL